MAFDHRRPSTIGPTPARIPPAPPLPPTHDPPKPGSFLDRFLFSGSSRRFGAQNVDANSNIDGLHPRNFSSSTYGSKSSLSTSHRTGLKIRALDINRQRSHVVLAGGKILKTVQVNSSSDSSTCVEDVDIRATAVNFASAGSQAQRETFDIEDVAWSHGQFANHIATAASNGKIMLYDLARPGIEVGRLHDHYRQVHKVDFNPSEGPFLLSGSQDGTVRLWDIRAFQSNVMTMYSKDTFPGRSDGVRHTKWSPRVTWSFALGTDNGNVQRWDTRNNTSPVLKIAAHSATCNSIDWHPDNKHLVSAGKDLNVKVWNLDGQSRQKPQFQFRAPKVVQNVRWRPPVSESSSGSDQFNQSTQLATSYRKYPVVHIWELRRPFMPFKEYHHQINNSTTDMLWHSKDRLWTVGPEGEFCQSDVRYLPKTLDRRPMQAFDMAPDDDMTFFTQYRPLRRLPQYDDDYGSRSSFETSRVDSRSPEMHLDSRIHAPDSLEDSSLSTSSPRKHSRTPSFKSGKSLGSTPPASYEDHVRPVVMLDETMRRKNKIIATQPALSGPFPGMTSGAVFAYLTRKLMATALVGFKFQTDLTQLPSICEQNARYAELANRSRTAQAWRLFGYQVEHDLKSRVSTLPRLVEHSPETWKMKSKALSKSTLSENQTQQQDKSLLNVLQSTSNATTPQAKPVDIGGDPRLTRLHNVDEIDTEQHLPPSLVSDTAGKYVDQTENSQLQEKSADLEIRQAWSAYQESQLKSQSTAHDQGQGFAQGTRLNRPEQKSQNIDVPIPLNKQMTSESFEMFPDSDELKSRARVVGSFNSNNYAQPDSNHSSFQGASGSMQSTSPADTDNRSVFVRSQTNSFTEESSPEEIFSTSETSRTTQPSITAHTATKALPSVYINDRDFTSQQNSRHSVPKSNVSEDSPVYPDPDIGNQPEATDPEERMNESDLHASPARASASIYSLIDLLDWHALSCDAQTTSHLYLHLSPLFATLQSKSPNRSSSTLYPHHRSYASYIAEVLSINQSSAATLLSPHLNPLPYELSPFYIESLLSTYHTQLQSLSLHPAAANLRKLSFPTYPAVYETSINDVEIALLCTHCRNPINTFHASGKCKTCSTTPAPCPICYCAVSPFTLPSTKRAKPTTIMSNSITGFPPSYDLQTTTLMTTCLHCNHTSHLTCLHQWFRSSSNSPPSLTDETCPTPGCLCACTAGGYASTNPPHHKEPSSQPTTTTTAPTPTTKIQPDPHRTPQSPAATRAALHLRKLGLDERERGALSDGEIERRSSASASFPPMSARAKASEKEKGERERGGRRVRVAVPDV